MAVAKPGPVLPITPFWSLAFRFERMGYEFKGIYEKIEDVWLLGKYLRWPFYFIQYAFFKVRDLCFDANIWLAQFELAIDALYDGWKFREILDDISYHYRWLRDNPYDWLLHHLLRVNLDIASIITNASGWFTSRFRGMSWYLRYFIDNPTGCILYILSYAIPTAYTFLLNPRSKLVSWMYSLFPIFRDFIYNPNSLIISLIAQWYPWFSNFLRSPTLQIVGMLKSFSYDLRLLINNPSFWFRHKLATALFVSVSDLDNMPVAIIKRIFYVIFRNELGMIDYIRNAVCNLFLRYI